MWRPGMLIATRSTVDTLASLSRGGIFVGARDVFCRATTIDLYSSLPGGVVMRKAGAAGGGGRRRGSWGVSLGLAAVVCLSGGFVRQELKRWMLI